MESSAQPLIAHAKAMRAGSPADLRIGGLYVAREMNMMFCVRSGLGIERGGYPLDSGSPYGLWLGFRAPGGRVNDSVIGCRIGDHRLLGEAEEELAAAL